MRKSRFWGEGPGSFLIAIGIALLIRWALFEAYVIPSGSMLPSLLVNDHLFVNKIVYGLRWPFTERWVFPLSEPTRGEVIIFRHPGDHSLFYVKRVVGLPGDRIFYENGNLYLNDQPVEKFVPSERAADGRWLRNEDFPGEAAEGGRENYAHWEEQLGEHHYSVLLRKGDRPAASAGPFTVPPGQYFVLGDNRDNSQDSRGWDPAAEHAHGQVAFTRQSGTGAVTIPSGTVVRTDQVGTWAQRFRTTTEVVLAGAEVRAEVRALEPGAMGNLAAGSIRAIDGGLSDQLLVTNSEELSGGSDKRFVPRSLLIGRVMFVWLSCEKKLPVLTFLCHPLHMRWSRLFHEVQ